MREAKIKYTLAVVDQAMAEVKDLAARKAISPLLDLVEELYAENVELRKENQKLKDEINRLKGEQGKPDFKKNGGKQKQGDFSTDAERRQAESSDDGNGGHGYKLDGNGLEKLKERRIPSDVLDRLEELKAKKFTTEDEFISAVETVIGKELTEQYRPVLLKHARYKKRKRETKLDKIKIDREQLCPVDKADLPGDACFTGHEDKVVQDLIVKSDNVRFKKEVYYSPSLKKTFTGNIPPGYEGEFGPHVNAQIVAMKYVNKERLENFREDYWNYYGKLFEYKKNPSPELAGELSDEFDRLFSTETGYRQLDERISKTKAKKDQLLLVLKYPELPLHNNKPENGARTQKRRQDVSLQTRNENGTRAKDTMMSIVETCGRLGVNAYDFIHDRVSGSFKLPSLANMIRKKARSG
jgi:hypothetical protein